MTPREEDALLAEQRRRIEADLGKAYQGVVDDIRRGVPPRDAVQRAFDSFRGEFAAALAKGFSEILGQSVAPESVLALQVGQVSLSQSLYAQSQSVSQNVATIVERRARGIADAKALARELFEGYQNRAPQDEPLQFKKGNPRLPKYMREALLSDPASRTEVARVLGQLQVDNLSTPALRAAYQRALDTLDEMADGTLAPGALQNAIRTAFYERMRFFSQRIAETELHRAYAEADARNLAADPTIEYVQVSRGADSGVACICDVLAGRDAYGLGAGVYPIRDAPVPPFHPFCRCRLRTRRDLTGRKQRPRGQLADVEFLSRFEPSAAARMVGSAAKLDNVFRGAPAESMANAGRNPDYVLRTVGGLTQSG